MAPSIVPTLVQVVLIVVQVIKQTTKVPQMTSPQEKQLKEQKQKVKNEYDTMFLEGEEQLHLDRDVYEDWMDTTGSPQHFQHLQHRLQ
jgi:hypothetical protein